MTARRSRLREARSSGVFLGLVERAWKRFVVGLGGSNSSAAVLFQSYWATQSRFPPHHRLPTVAPPTPPPPPCVFLDTMILCTFRFVTCVVAVPFPSSHYPQTPTPTPFHRVEAHPIPEHPRPRRCKGRIALVGDAAGYVTKCSGEVRGETPGLLWLTLVWLLFVAFCCVLPRLVSSVCCLLAEAHMQQHMSRCNNWPGQ